MPLARLGLQIGCALITLIMVSSLFIAGQTGHAAGLVKAPIDKLVHFGFWFICAGTTQVALWTEKPVLKWALGLLVLISATEEFLQIWTINRQAELLDALMNLSGIASCALLGYLLRRAFSIERAT